MRSHANSTRNINMSLQIILCATRRYYDSFDGVTLAFTNNTNIKSYQPNEAPRKKHELASGRFKSK